MIKLAIICLVVALVAAILGFGGVAGTFAHIAVWLFVIALVLAALFFVFGLLAGRKIKNEITRH
ncbi:DUF1328 domain-containing protein [Erythrobacter sp. 3-20A1M]|uniref:DUF1328 domain-containing protein n=1 Tax=Erythrobacter sp. 3-20A1M TaxID=2653850 RepID=UPI001BFC32D6|nr:DUF1328 domain-containing protein [Erythrobacter sp. 3-20A1M]QWC57330.1 DUF1328 domain-containing protein [Erythrobacter sp. 3-20A1M]